MAAPKHLATVAHLGLEGDLSKGNSHPINVSDGRAGIEADRELEPRTTCGLVVRLRHRDDSLPEAPLLLQARRIATIDEEQVRQLNADRSIASHDDVILPRCRRYLCAH